ncbi:PilZ domain-containing protein [Tindallia californiensis]|uniref:PilZ domain-containing protein n=1 Tax=Tindallia californiensis TaxID=159292 RepID=A0A1H3IIH5_9FIRM|nr:PilZ domain-containing protein [Tindallia californiensis]SDY26644.1 PilZ domain-containing protein [Tindallia californiensis]
MEEKRKVTRIEFHIKGKVKSRNINLIGQVHDLSLKGLFLKVEKPLEASLLGEKVEVLIELMDHASNIEIQAEGSIVRMEENGIGIRLEHIDLDSFTHLKNIISYNAGDHDRIMDEFVDTMYHED